MTGGREVPEGDWRLNWNDWGKKKDYGDREQGQLITLCYIFIYGDEIRLHITIKNHNWILKIVPC